MIQAKGTNGTIRFDGHTIVLDRKGIGARVMVGKGSKSIPIASVTAIQWKPAGLTAGVLSFTLAGGVEVRSKFGRQARDGMQDENSVAFHKRRQAAFERVRDAIQAAINDDTGQPATQSSMTDELTRLAQLHQQGALSAAEFEAAKARLLA